MTKIKKKLTTLVLSVIMVLTLCIGLVPMFSMTAFAAEALTVTIDTGESVTLNDTNGDGYYEIGTADELYAFAAAVNGGKPSINGKLTANITVNTNINDANRRDWTPIGNDSYMYTGIFDGDNKTISGLYYSNSSTYGVGLFGYLGYVDGATVKNVGVVNSHFSGNQHVGGVVGANIKGTVENCFSSASVSGSSFIGGVVGHNQSTVRNCYNTGSVSCTGSSVGGVVGYDNGTVENCYNTGSVSGTSYRVGGVVGCIDSSTVTNCYYLKDCATDGSGVAQQGIGAESKGSTTTDVAGSTTRYEDFTTGEVAWLLNGETSDGVWKQTLGDNGDASPNFTGAMVVLLDGSYTNHIHDLSDNGICTCGTYEAATFDEAADVYKIANAGQLLWFANFVNSGNYSANAILTTNINLENREWTTICSTDLYYNTTTYSDAVYTGTFDGDGHVISNFTVKGISGSKCSVGLFGTAYGATIKNLGVTGMTFDLNGATDVRAAAIVGQMLPGTTVTNCYVTDSTLTPNEFIVGGIAACNYGGTISNCYTYNVTVSANARCGNLVSDCRGDINTSDRVGTVTNCYTDAARVVGTQSVAANVTNCQTNVRAARFANGEIVYLLNGSSSTGAWKLKNGIPTFKGDTVYENTCGGDVFYSTTEGEHDAHSLGSDFRCTLCGNYDAPTLVDGYYQIATPSNLLWFAEAVNDGQYAINAKLTNNIDLNNVAWTPIGKTAPYTGTLDGNNKYVNLGDQSVTTGEYGFISKLGENGMVKNLTVKGDFTIDASSCDGVAGIVGRISAISTVEGCISYVNITVGENGTSSLKIAGIVGTINQGYGATISKCANYGTIKADGAAECVAGIMGYGHGDVLIVDCANYGDISSNTANYVAGIISYMNHDAFDGIQNCLNVGTITGGSYVGDIAGWARSYTSGGITNNYYTGEAAFGADGSGDAVATKVTEVQLTSGEVAYLLGSAWGMTSEADGTPKLGSEIAASAQDFIIVGQQLNLGADLSMKYHVYGYSYNEDGEKVDFDATLLKMQFTFLGEVTTVTGTLDEDTGYYVFILKGITPQCMDDKINAAVLYDGAETGEALTGYSVVQNLRNLLEKYSDDAALVTLINDTLAYGKAASDYKYYPSFNENYGSDREIPEAEYTWEGGTGGDAGDYIYQFAIRFGTMNHVKIRLHEALGANMTLTIDGEAATLIPDTTTDYVSKGIAASDFNKDIVICVMDGTDVVETLTVSVNDLLDIAYKSYMSVDMSHAEYEKYENLATLTKALYNYGVSAHVYARCPKGDHHYVNGECYCGVAPYTYDETTKTYTVYSAEGLYAWLEAAQADLSTNLVLMADITLPNTDLTTGEEITVENGVPSGSNWTPISTDWEKGYIGTFDGNNHTITGLRINTEKNYASLIGTLGADGEVKNLTLANAVVYGTGSSVSGFVAYISGGTISWCTFGSSTTDGSSVSGAGSVGGIIYKNASGLVSYCINNGTISASGTDAQAVGIAAQTSNGTVSNCTNNGSVSVSCGSETTFAEAGGIVGYTKSNSTVLGCINNGFVSATGVSISAGGIVGWNANSTVSDCENTGDALGTGEYIYVGGIVGYNQDSTVSGCKNTGDAKGTGSTESLVGGIVGYTVNGTVDETNDNKGIPTTNVGNG